MILLEISPSRQEIDRLLHPSEGYDAIGELDGITIVERRSPALDRNYKCAEYVFGTVMKEPWAKRWPIRDAFWRNTLRYLEKRGYEVKDSADPGDVVGYASDNIYTSSVLDNHAYLFFLRELNKRRKPPYFQHFGIFLDANQVISKFNGGHIYQHRLDRVPNSFGTSVYFFRKCQS